MSKSNEGRCCDAVIRVIESREGGTRRMRSIDTLEAPGVEAVCDIAGKVYALEHTTIDPYPDRRADDQRFLSVLRAIESEIEECEVLRADWYYELLVDIHAFRDLDRKSLAAVCERLRGFVVVHSRALEPPSRGRSADAVGRVEGVNGWVALRAFKGDQQNGGRIRMVRGVPDKLEELRRERMRRVVGKKGPKLHAAHAAGQTSVLVIEDFDIAISNHILIAAALFQELDSSTFVVDEIYLVDTSVAAEWWVMMLARGDARWPTDDENPPMWRFSPEVLQELAPD